jgi:hypothetical protein
VIVPARDEENAHAVLRPRGGAKELLGGGGRCPGGPEGQGEEGGGEGGDTWGRVRWLHGGNRTASARRRVGYA